MDDSLKQRIVGALVVLAVIVIFVPVIFDKDHIEPLDRTTQIPPSPKIVTVPMDFPEIDTSQEYIEATPKEEAFVPQEDERIEVTESLKQSAKIKGTSRDKTGVPLAWSIQVASFSDEARAKSFQSQLIEDGHTTYVKTVTLNGAKKIRVFVGPKLNKNTLLSVKETIEKKYRLKTLLIRVKP